MTLLEILLFVFILIEAWQLRQLIWTSKKAVVATNNTNKLIDDLLHDPKVAGAILLNGFVGMAEGMKDNKKFQSVFFDFMKDIGSQIQAKIDPSEIILSVCQKMRHNTEFRNEVGDFANYLGENALLSIKTNVKQDLTDSVKKTIEKEIPLPKKYRWAKPYLDDIVKKREEAKKPEPVQGSDGGLLPL